MTSNTVASVTSLVKTKTITIKFKAFCFFTITEDFLVWIYLFRRIYDLTCFCWLCPKPHLFLGWTLWRLMTLLILIVWLRLLLNFTTHWWIRTWIIFFWTRLAAGIHLNVRIFILKNYGTPNWCLALIWYEIMMLFDNWCLYFIDLARKTIIRSKILMLMIIRFRRYRKRR